MSFSLSLDGGALEWASHDLSTIFVQRRNLFSPSFLTMIWDVVRFGREAPRVLEPAASHLYSSMTLGQYLERHRYSTAFRDNYVLPMCAAVWSVPNATVCAVASSQCSGVRMHPCTADSLTGTCLRSSSWQYTLGCWHVQRAARQTH